MTSQYCLILKMCHIHFIYKYIFNISYVYLSWFTLTSKWHLVTHSYGSSLRGEQFLTSQIYLKSRYLYRKHVPIGFALKTSVYPLSNHALSLLINCFSFVTGYTLLPKRRSLELQSVFVKEIMVNGRSLGNFAISIYLLILYVNKWNSIHTYFVNILFTRTPHCYWKRGVWKYNLCL